MINGLLILLISLFCDEYEGGVYGLLAVRFLLSYPCVTHYVSVLCHLCLCLPHLLCVLVLSLCFILCFLSHVCVWSPSASHLLLTVPTFLFVPMSVSFFWLPCQAMCLSLHLSMFPVLF